MSFEIIQLTSEYLHTSEPLTTEPLHTSKPVTTEPLHTSKPVTTEPLHTSFFYKFFLNKKKSVFHP